MWSCRRRRLPSSWTNTKRRVKVPCPQRRNLTKAHPRRVVLAAEGAKASSTGEVVRVHEGAEELSRTVATLEEVRTSHSTWHNMLFFFFWFVKLCLNKNTSIVSLDSAHLIHLAINYMLNLVTGVV